MLHLHLTKPNVMVLVLCRWVILCSEDGGNGVLSTKVQPSVALVKLIFTELGWHFENGGGYLDEAALEQYDKDRAVLKESRKQ